MDYTNILNKRVQSIPPSGIRKYFDLLEGMENAISLWSDIYRDEAPWLFDRENPLTSLNLGAAIAGEFSRLTTLELQSRIVGSKRADFLDSQYQQVLSQIEYGGTAYRRTAGNFRGFTTSYNPCANLCLCYFLNLFCCGGRGLFLCC